MRQCLAACRSAQCDQMSDRLRYYISRHEYAILTEWEETRDSFKSNPKLHSSILGETVYLRCRIGRFLLQMTSRLFVKQKWTSPFIWKIILKFKSTILEGRPHLLSSGSSKVEQYGWIMRWLWGWDFKPFVSCERQRRSRWTQSHLDVNIWSLWDQN